MAIEDVARDAPAAIGSAGLIMLIVVVSLALILFLSVRVVDLSRKMNRHQERKNIKSLKIQLAFQVLLAVSIALGAEITVALLLTGS